MGRKQGLSPGVRGRLLRYGAALALAAASLPLAVVPAGAAPPAYAAQGTIAVAPAAPVLTAVDPLAYVPGTDVIPSRPFLYSVDKNGITITRFNDNVVVGTWPWPDELWITLPDGGQMAIPKPAGGWEPVAMTVSAPTETEIANRVKEIPDLTPPWTFAYVVMARSGYEWQSAPDAALLESSNVRDHVVPSTNPDTESAVLVQINLNDPSFSASRDPAAPSDPHIAGALLGHGAGQPVYDPKTGNVYVGNMPSGSLPAGAREFISVIGRIPDTVAAEEREIPGVGQPVIRCGPQHPESGIPVGKPQAYACYDPGALHIVNDNEHVGGFDALKDRDADGTLDQQYVWEFRNLPSWLTAHKNPVTNEYDGILYGTPPATGEWFGEARTHNLDDEWGIFSDWHPIRLLVTPTAEYLAISNKFAVGTPVAYPLEGTGSCALTGAPAWVESATVPSGCVVMGRAPISGEHYSFRMPGFRQAGYPDIELTFSGDVVGGYGFVPLPEGAAVSGLAWHQISKVADPSTETAVLSAEFVGVDPSTGQLYRVLQVPGQPQPPNERPAETALKADTVSAEGTALSGSGFGPVAVEADRDIFVGAAGAVIKVSGGSATTIGLPDGMQASSLSLDSDLRTAIPGVEDGQVDHGALWATGTGKVALIDTVAATVTQSFPVANASSVTVDFGPRWAYVANGSDQLAIFGPQGSKRPPMEPRIWSSEELNFNEGYAGTFRLMATGDPLPTIDKLGELPAGLSYVDTGNGFPTISGIPEIGTGSDGYAYAMTATNAVDKYAQAFGITVYGPAKFTSAPSATFTAGTPSAFTVSATAPTGPILYTWDEEPVMAPGVKLVDNENGTASLKGIPTTPGTYQFTVRVFTGYLTDEQDPAQLFTLTVNPAGTAMAPTISSADSALFEAVGAPFAPDQVTVTAAGSPTPTLSVETKAGQTGLPFGVNFIDNGDGTGALGSGCAVTWPGMAPECLAALFEGTEGTYTFTIKAQNSAGVTEQPFTLVLEKATSIMTPPPTDPAILSFDYTKGGTMPAAQTFSVGTLGDTMPYAAVTTARWLNASPVSGTVPGPLGVSVDPTGLAAGTYTGSVIVTSAGTDGPFAVATVTFTVSDVPSTLLAPRSLAFQYAITAGAAPPAQTVALTTGGIPLSYTVASSASWLKVSPTSGKTPAKLSVSVDAARLGLGAYTGTLTITSAGAANGPQKLSVTLIKALTLTDFSIKVSNDVGSGPEGLSVNRNTHQVFVTTENEAAAEAGGESSSGGEVEQAEPANPAAGAAVFRIDPAIPKTVGRTLVHSSGEYVAVNSKTGRVYHASQGTGEVAVIDGATNKVLGFVPLTINGAAYLPYQIAIDEAQNLIYVGGHAPAIPDPIKVAGKPFKCKAIHEMPDNEYDCWNPGSVFVIDGNTNKVVGSFKAGDDPEGVVFAAATHKVFASNEDDGSVTVAIGAIRNRNGSITPAKVIGTIIKGNMVPGWWQPKCDANNYCGERGQAALWPAKSVCNGLDDEAEEADKMTVDPLGNVYIIDDRYRVARINFLTNRVEKVLAIQGFDCELEVPDGSTAVFRNTANNIAFSAPFNWNPFGWRLFVTSEQNTFSVIDPMTMTLKQIVTVPDAGELDAIATDPALGRVFITDEDLGAMWILQEKKK